MEWMDWNAWAPAEEESDEGEHTTRGDADTAPGGGVRARASAASSRPPPLPRRADAPADLAVLERERMSWPCMLRVVAQQGQVRVSCASMGRWCARARACEDRGRDGEAPADDSAAGRREFEKRTAAESLKKERRREFEKRTAAESLRQDSERQWRRQASMRGGE
jgi:hypothetical protein